MSNNSTYLSSLASYDRAYDSNNITGVKNNKLDVLQYKLLIIENEKNQINSETEITEKDEEMLKQNLHFKHKIINLVSQYNSLYQEKNIILDVIEELKSMKTTLWNTESNFHRIYENALLDKSFMNEFKVDPIADEFKFDFSENDKKCKLIDNIILHRIKQESDIKLQIHKVKQRIELYNSLVSCQKVDTSDEGNYKNNNNDFHGKCPICFQNSIQVCINPCGHCFCSDCINKNGSKQECYICRSKIINKITLLIE